MPDTGPRAISNVKVIHFTGRTALLMAIDNENLEMVNNSMKSCVFLIFSFITMIIKVDIYSKNIARIADAVQVTICL